MSTTINFEQLASSWAQVAKEVGFPADYEGTASPEAHRANEAIQEMLREHIVATKDMRLFGLLHLLGQVSLQMEQALWPEDYARITREVENSLREADDPSTELIPHEVVKADMERQRAALQKRLTQGRRKDR